MDIFVGKKIRLYRNLQGLSQMGLAEQLGVTFQQVQKYERGINRVSAGRLYDLSRILGVDVGKFFEGDVLGGGASPSNDCGTTGAVELNDGNIELVRLYESIEDEALKKSLVRFVKAYLSESGK